MNIRIAILGLSIACSAVFGDAPASSTNRNEDLRVILSPMFLSEHTQPFLGMLAAEAATALGSDKTIDQDKLIEEFCHTFEKEAAISQFAEPYAIFNDEELHQLRVIYESPVFQKYNLEITKIFPATLQTTRELFKNLAETLSVVKKAEAEHPSLVFEITQENYAKEIEQSDKPVIIDLYSTSCPPCRLLEPIYEELSREYKGEIRFARINCEREQELARKFEVTSLPTIVFIRPGTATPTMKTTGFTTKKNFQAKIHQFLEKDEIAQGTK